MAWRGQRLAWTGRIVATTPPTHRARRANADGKEVKRRQDCMLTRRLSLFALALPHCLGPQRRVFTADSDAARGEEKPARGGSRVGEENGRRCLCGASQTARQPQTSQQCRPVHRWWTAGKREAFDTVTLICTPQQTAEALAVVSSVASHGLRGFDCRGESASQYEGRHFARSLLTHMPCWHPLGVLMYISGPPRKTGGKQLRDIHTHGTGDRRHTRVSAAQRTETGERGYWGYGRGR